MKKIASTLGKCFLFCSIFILFASCENFLKGADIRSQLEESIEIANSEPISYYIIADAESGTAIPTQVTKRKKESFDLKFIPSEGWQFICWEAINTDTQQVDPDAISFTDPQSLETSAKILKPGKNIQIHPKCILLPAIVSVAPEDAAKCYANASIVITFNMPMEDASVSSSDSIFNFNNIAITYVGQDLTDCFEAPVFNSQKTILTIDTKGDALSEFIALQNRTFIDLQITFGPNIVVLNQGIESQLTQGSQSFTIRRNADTETVKPLKDIFFVRTEPITFETAATLSPENCYTQDDLSTFDDAKILKNRTEQSVYIYAVFHDDDSGIRKITVTEQRTNNKSGSIVFEQPVSIDYTSKNTEFHNEGDGSVTACIKYDLKSDDGAILLSVAAVDVCNNVSIPQTVTAIKDSKIDLSGVELYNLDYLPSNANYIGVTTIFYFTSDGAADSNKYNLNNFNRLIRELKLNDLNRKVYGSYVIPETSIHVELVYNNKTVSMTNNPGKKRWEYTLGDTEDVSNLSITLKITDESDRTVSKQFCIPGVPDITNIFKEKYSGSEYQYIAQAVQSSSATNLVSVPIPTSDKVAYMSHEKYYNVAFVKSNDYVLNNKYFFVNERLAGPTTRTFTTSDINQTASDLPPVKISDATMEPGVDGETLDFEVKIDTAAGNPWDTYDSIIVQYMRGDSILYSFSVPDNSLVAKFGIPFTVKAYANTSFLRLIGIIDGQLSKDYIYGDYNDPHRLWYVMDSPATNPSKYDARKPIIQSWPGYDSVVPISYMVMSFSKEIPERYDYILPVSVRDAETSYNTDGSGISKLNVTVNNCEWNYINENDYLKTSLSYSQNSGLSGDCPVIPIWDFDNELNSVNIKFYDAVGNCLDWTKTVVSLDIPAFSITPVNSSSYTSVNVTSEQYSGEYCKWILGITKFSDNKWVKHAEHRWDSQTPSVPDVTQTQGKKTYKYSNISLPTDSFVKMVVSAEKGDGSAEFSEQYGNSAPQYFYTGTQRNSGNYDYISPYVNDDPYVFVISDAPTFVHTLVTKHSFEECSKWKSVNKWEHNHRHIGDKYLVFSTDPERQRYRIPVEEMDSGDCYVVIAHFADGTSAISEVMQKD